MTPEQSRNAFRKLCENWKYFRGTPVRYWFEQEFYDLFDVRVRPSADTADENVRPDCREARHPQEYVPAARSIYQRFNIGAIATTDDPCSDLSGHAKLLADPTWDSKVAPTFRPDAYLEPGRSNWNELTNNLGEVTGVNVDTYAGNLEADEDPPPVLQGARRRLLRSLSRRCWMREALRPGSRSAVCKSKTGHNRAGGC